MSTVGYILKEEQLCWRRTTRAKEKMLTGAEDLEEDKKIALTEIRAGGGRMLGLAEVLQWDMQIVRDILTTGKT